MSRTWALSSACCLELSMLKATFDPHQLNIWYLRSGRSQGKGPGFKSHILMLISNRNPFICWQKNEATSFSICYAAGGEKIRQAPRRHPKNITLSQLEVPPFCMKQVGKSFSLHSMWGERRGPVSLQKERLPWHPLLITTNWLYLSSCCSVRVITVPPLISENAGNFSGKKWLKVHTL